MSYQNDLTPKIRANLINFIHMISENLNLNDKTLYLSIQILDRFLSLNKIDIYLLYIYCKLFLCLFLQI